MSRVYPLTDEQRPAVDPAQVVWLSASAGTGKTQVLSARVLRLLLEEGVRPDQILCLTFTKAGATEMAARIKAGDFAGAGTSPDSARQAGAADVACSAHRADCAAVLGMGRGDRNSLRAP